MLSATFDSVLSPLTPPPASLVGPMPRELALRRVVDKTESLLRSEGREVDHNEMMEIARIVERASLSYQLPPSLIFSVIHSESHFRRDAVSPDGAMGLMQIQLETAKAARGDRGLPLPTGLRLFDRETNIFLGYGLSAVSARSFRGSGAALAAYHVGPTEIGRRINQGEPFSDDVRPADPRTGEFQTISMQAAPADAIRTASAG